MTVWVTRGSAIDPPKVLYKVPYKVCFTRCLTRCFARCLTRCFTRCLTRCLREGRGRALMRKQATCSGNSESEEVAETPAHRSGQGAAETTPVGFTSTLGLTKTPVLRSIAKTVWPSGLRRWLKAPVRKGVGSNAARARSPRRFRRLNPLRGGRGGGYSCNITR